MPAPTLSEMPVVPLSAPEFGGREWQYVKACLDGGWVSSAGPFVERFEQMAAESLGVRHAVAVVNGTAALHLALLAAGVEPDDEVIVPSLTFVASANAVRYCGAWPVFADADPATWQMDPARVEEFVAQRCRWNRGRLINARTKRRVRAILPVHLLGHPCDMDSLLRIARRRRLRVIEDAAQSLGASYRGRPVGALGDAACLSFNGNKVITAGGGGMVVTQRAAWARRARYLSTQAKDDGDEYIHRALGYNYRLSNLHAAVGCAQLEQLPPRLAAKARIAARYREAFADLPEVACPPVAPWASPTHWLFTIRARGRGNRSAKLAAFLAGQGIEARRLWRPLHRLPIYRGAEQIGGAVADALYAGTVSLPSSTSLTEDDQERVIAAVRGWVTR